MDLKLDADGDLALEGGDLVLVDGVEAIEQRLRIRLKTFQGEWFLDQGAGIPYFQQVLVKNPNLAVVQSLYRKAILETPGVVGLDEIKVDFDRGTRRLAVRFKAQTKQGPTTYSEQAEI